MGNSHYKSIGYIRTIISEESSIDEVKALKKEGCKIIYKEEVDPLNEEQGQPVLNLALSSLSEGDEVVVTHLDRLAKDSNSIFRKLNELQKAGIQIRTLDGLINTKKLGKLAPQLIGFFLGLKEVEKSLEHARILEKTRIRKAKGLNTGGRPKTNQAKENLVLRLRKEGFSYRSIREQTSLALSTIRRIIVERAQ